MASRDDGRIVWHLGMRLGLRVNAELDADAITFLHRARMAIESSLRNELRERLEEVTFDGMTLDEHRRRER